MNANPLKSIASYSQYVAELLAAAIVRISTVSVWSTSPYTGVAEGEVFFVHGFRLRIREELDFNDGLITAYGYEFYHNEKRLFRYDDFPHPNDPGLNSSFPHHKHVPPDMKHHHIPAPQLSFNQPNLPALIQEIADLIKGIE